MSEEDETDLSEEENKKRDEEFMQNLLHSISVLKQENPEGFVSESLGPGEPEPVEPTEPPKPVDLDSLTVKDLHTVLGRIDHAIALNQRLQGILLMKEVKLLAIKRQLSAPKPRKEKQAEEQRTDVGRYYVRFKAPYFKNIHNFSGYVIVPESQLPVTSQRYETPGGQWNKAALRDLEANVRAVMAARSFKEMMKSKPKTFKQKTMIIDRYSFLKKHAPMTALVGPDFDTTIDWCQVASKLRKEFSPNECQKAWNIFLKPEINKKKWTLTEKENLKKIALEHNYQGWDEIACELGTGRNGYQCFHLYVDKIMRLVEGDWSRAEEDFLTKLIKECTYGEKIMWHKVAYFFETRTLNQLYRKWTLSCVGKEVVAGAFTEEEDKVIMDMLIVRAGQYSINQVAKQLNRITSQIRYRFSQLKSSLRHKYGEWSVEEDRQLLQLVEKFGKKNWSLIAEHMPDRGRVQIRHRYTNIRKKLAANPELDLERLRRHKRPVHSKRKESNLKFLMELAGMEDPPEAATEADAAVQALENIVGPSKKRQRRFEPRETIRFPDFDGEPPALVDDDDILETLEFPMSPEERNPNPMDPKPPGKKFGKAAAQAKRNVVPRTKPESESDDEPAPKAKPPSSDICRDIVEHYILHSDFCSNVAKPQEPRGLRRPANVETLNSILKFNPYKHFDSNNADWTYDADRSDPYYNEIFKMLENKDQDEAEVENDEKVLDHRLLPPCLTNFEGFYNLLVDMGFTENDLQGPDEKFDRELKKLYCEDDETIAAVDRWNRRLATVFAWPAALSEISLEPDDDPPEAAEDVPSTSKARPKRKPRRSSVKTELVDDECTRLSNLDLVDEAE